jgi:hypothetical protein
LQLNEHVNGLTKWLQCYPVSLYLMVQMVRKSLVYTAIPHNILVRIVFYSAFRKTAKRFLESARQAHTCEALFR